MTPGSRWRHIRTGKVVEVLGFCKLQAADSPLDGQDAVRYLCTGQEWVRPRAEFLDGRFVEVTALAREGRVHVWTPTQDAQLGKAPDTTLARRLQCKTSVVQSRRTVLGVPAYKPAVREPAARQWDRIHAMAKGFSLDDLAVLRDGTSAQCAERFHVSREYVRLLRQVCGCTERLRTVPAEPLPSVP